MQIDTNPHKKLDCTDDDWLRGAEFGAREPLAKSVAPLQARVAFGQAVAHATLGLVDVI